MKHVVKIERISHDHEYQIHARISTALGYDTWDIGRAYYPPGRDRESEIDLVLEFPSIADYYRCRDVLGR